MASLWCLAAPTHLERLSSHWGEWRDDDRPSFVKCDNVRRPHTTEWRPDSLVPPHPPPFPVTKALTKLATNLSSFHSNRWHRSRRAGCHSTTALVMRGVTLQAERSNPKKLPPPARHHPDRQLIDGGFSILYHPCWVTLTPSILDIGIHAATGAGATECHIPLGEWVTASNAPRPTGAKPSLVQGLLYPLARWLWPVKSHWSDLFMSVVKSDRSHCYRSTSLELLLLHLSIIMATKEEVSCRTLSVFYFISIHLQKNKIKFIAKFLLCQTIYYKTLLPTFFFLSAKTTTDDGPSETIRSRRLATKDRLRQNTAALRHRQPCSSLMQTSVSV